MAEIFHPMAGISEVRGLIMMIRDDNRRHSMQLSMIARKSGRNIDFLLPTVEACRMLGFAKVSKGSVTLTPAGLWLSFGNWDRHIGGRLRGIEPFRSTLGLLSEYGHIHTRALLGMLNDRGISMGGSERENEERLRKVLLRWGVRCKLMEYSHSSDVWRRRR